MKHKPELNWEEKARKILGDGDVEEDFSKVPLDEELVLNVILFDGDHEDECFEFVLGHHDEESTRKQGCYELQVKFTWTGVLG
ncbi:hypothetical protein E2562_026527 [Oryza meyeriana var. granulata]|uniref:Uncharacterized protein n=1 Tax=Oryza meyeriana var. granulata TaxID=110450 RepID=A0A6G1DNR1_9ORYZ|nr:hypothetical protein E2562_026527 [Oryza meyeriana var. granulata]